MYALIAAGRLQPDRYPTADAAIAAGQREYGTLFGVARQDGPQSRQDGASAPVTAYGALVAEALARLVEADRRTLADMNGDTP